MKTALHAILLVVLLAGWVHFVQSRGEAAAMVGRADAAAMVGQFESSDVIRKAADEKESLTVFTGVLLAFLSAGFVGIAFVAYVLPAMANKFTHALYESGASVEADPMRDARALVAQGNYAAALEAFRQAAGKLEGNRIPWIEMVKLQREHLDDPLGAAATLREALEGHAWSEEDGGFLMFRLADVYADGLQDQETAAGVLLQLTEQFPQTRHSANARHRLQQWGREIAAT